MNNIKKIQEYKYVIIIILVILLSAFYWYEWRPSQIRERCSAEAHLDQRTIKETDDIKRQALIYIYYGDCLMRFGLK